MGRNLKYQLLTAIDKNFKECMDKHSMKHTEGIGNGKIYSYADRKNLIDFSSNFANYMKENYPGVKMAKDINADHIQSFFNFKGKECSKATLQQYKSKFNKLEQLVNKTYNTKANYSSGYVIPLTKENTAKLRDVSMTQQEYNKLMNAMQNSKSSAKTAIELSGRFGLRVSETTKLQARDIDLNKGVIKVVDSKGGRSREIPIEQHDKAFCEGLKASLSDNERIVPIQSDSVNRALQRGLSKAGLSGKFKDAKSGIHSIRKMVAQEEYNKNRESGLSSGASCSMVSNYLGHGNERYELMKEYIENIW